MRGVYFIEWHTDQRWLVWELTQVDQATVQTKRICDDIKNGLKGKRAHSLDDRAKISGSLPVGAADASTS